MNHVSDWLSRHPILTYLIIYIFLVYVYNNVFRVRKLPLLKDALIYLLVGVGAFILLLFQHDLGLPIVYCLAVAVFLMLLVRIRYYNEKRSQSKSKP